MEPRTAAFRKSKLDDASNIKQKQIHLITRRTHLGTSYVYASEALMVLAVDLRFSCVEEILTSLDF